MNIGGIDFIDGDNPESPLHEKQKYYQRSQSLRIGSTFTRVACVGVKDADVQNSLAVISKEIGKIQEMFDKLKEPSS